jgi:hypothetical protein
MWHAYGRFNLYWDLFVHLTRRGRLEDLRIYGRIILKWIFKIENVSAPTGFIWLRLRANGGM